MMEQKRDAAAQDVYEDAWENEEDITEEEEWVSYPPEYLARSMSDALERLKDFDPFAI